MKQTHLSDDKYQSAICSVQTFFPQFYFSIEGDDSIIYASVNWLEFHERKVFHAESKTGFVGANAGSEKLQ